VRKPGLGPLSLSLSFFLLFCWTTYLGHPLRTTVYPCANTEKCTAQSSACVCWGELVISKSRCSTPTYTPTLVEPSIPTQHPAGPCPCASRLHPPPAHPSTRWQSKQPRGGQAGAAPIVQFGLT
jgi:hypothetical protein